MKLEVQKATSVEEKENTAMEIESNASPAKKTTPKSKAAKGKQTKATHPKTSDMVNAAIRELKDRKGSSLQAIKKYITSTYKVDGEKLAPFIKRYLKSAVTSGAVVQTKGKGASGSFKLSVNKAGGEPKAKTQKTTKVTQAKKPKKSVEKKTTSPRKPATTKKSPVKKTETAKKAPAAKKSPAKTEKVEKAKKAKPAAEKAISKSKRTAKAPAAKTKTPKPKKAAVSKAAKSPAKK